MERIKEQDKSISNDETDSSYYNNGGVVIKGGLGIHKNISVGGNLTVFNHYEKRPGIFQSSIHVETVWGKLTKINIRSFSHRPCFYSFLYDSF